jgi:single-strand DNA-binding protein
VLDRAGGGGGDFGSDDSGGEFGACGPSQQRKPAMAGAGSKGGDMDGDMDDEIPF